MCGGLFCLLQSSFLSFVTFFHNYYKPLLARKGEGASRIWTFSKTGEREIEAETRNSGPKADALICRCIKTVVAVIRGKRGLPLSEP